MKHLLRILSVVIVLTSISAFADSVNNFTNLNVNFGIIPNTGSGDNMGGQIFGAGVNLIAVGGPPFSWFGIAPPGYLPGSVGGGTTTIYFDYASGTIGSQSYLGNVELVLLAATFNTGSFTFPTNGQQNFNVTLPASISPITGLIEEVCTNANDCPPSFTLTTKPGTLRLSFTYSSIWDWYEPNSGSFTTTPEPSTLLLLGTGLLSVIGTARRKLVG